MWGRVLLAPRGHGVGVAGDHGVLLGLGQRLGGQAVARQLYGPDGPAGEVGGAPGEWAEMVGTLPSDIR